MTRIISNSEDTLDSRDIIARIAELQDAEVTAKDDPEGSQFGVEDAEELRVLLALEEEAAGYCEDWRYGAPLIRDSYFTAYAQELAEDIVGAMKHGNDWPFRHIDWDAAADELKQDYTEVDYDGVSYWIR